MRRLIVGPYTPSAEQLAAYRAMRSALAAGKLIRAQVCERCQRAGKVSGHHHLGYAPEHWLDVQWLCGPCHASANVEGKQKATRPIADRLKSRRRKSIRVDVAFLLDVVGGAR